MRKSRLSKYKQNKLSELFVAVSTARTAAPLASVNVKTLIYCFHRLREIIYRNDSSIKELDGEIEVNESNFAVGTKLNAGEKRLVKCRYLTFKSEMVRFAQ